MKRFDGASATIYGIFFGSLAPTGYVVLCTGTNIVYRADPVEVVGRHVELGQDISWSSSIHNSYVRSLGRHHRQRLNGRQKSV